MGFFDKEDWLYEDADDAYSQGRDEGASSGATNKMAHDMGFGDGQKKSLENLRQDYETFNNAVAPDDDPEDDSEEYE